MGPDAPRALSARRKTLSRREIPALSRDEIVRTPKTAAPVKIERADDPVWSERGRLLIEFLGQPRSWRDLCRWSRDHQLGIERMRHTLAHLGNAFRVLKGKDKVVRWVRHGVAAEGEELQWTDRSKQEHL